MQGNHSTKEVRAVDESTFYACWKVIDTLEMEAFKELEFLWKHEAYEHELDAQINRVFGITRAKQMLDLKCHLTFGKSVKELDHD